jgi:hypothetical protein
LQSELSALRAENKQLRADKEDVEKHFMEYKIKSDETIAKLRGKNKIKITIDSFSKFS